MNSIKHLFEKIASYDNVVDALHDEYVGCTGRRKRYVDELLDEDRLPDSVKDVQERLYAPKLTLYPPVVFDRVENRKLRHIVAPNVDDAILIRAITRVAEPEVYRKMTRHSYCPVRGRGGLRLAQDLKRKLYKLHGANASWMDQHPGSKRTIYALKTDIRHFFPSVTHEVAMDALRRVFGTRGDVRVLALIDQLMGEHLDIGAGYSAMAANAVLFPVDEQFESYLGVLGYFRFMDDILMLFRSKDKAHKARIELEKLINGFGLTMANKWRVFDTEKRPVVMGGFKVRWNGIHPSSHVCQGLNRQINKGIRIGFENLSRQECRSLASRYGWIKNSDSFTYKKKWRNNHAEIIFKHV